MRAGYCSECHANIWLNDDGTCVNGHAASGISNIYEPDQPPPPRALAVRKEIPRWAAAVWGLILAALTAFELIYVVMFTIGLTSFASPSSPAWADDLLFSGELFGIIMAATLLSFAFIGLSFLHIFAWSGLPMERKGVWAAVVFAGMQPGMLVYWFMNVWRQERPRDSRHSRPAPDTAIQRVWLLMLGILTVLPILYLLFFFIIVGSAATGSQASGLVNLIPVLHMGVMLLWWALTAFYLIHVFRTPRLEGTPKAIWAVLIAFGGPLAWPVYWYVNMWRRVTEVAPASA